MPDRRLNSLHRESQNLETLSTGVKENMQDLVANMLQPPKFLHIGEVVLDGQILGKPTDFRDGE